MEMDLVHDGATDILEEDRISNLPDEIIHHILSFVDMKYAIQTSTLSKKWKHIWISMPHLNLSNEKFRTSLEFAKFVEHTLSHRNHHTEVSAVELSFAGAPTRSVVKSIVNYAYSHNVRKLTLRRLRFSRKIFEFPQYLFSSQTLKHLTLATKRRSLFCGSCVPNSAWDFPVLETLNLRNQQLGDERDRSLNLFSKCVNLKCLTLHRCTMYALDVFNIYAPQLSNLTITNPDSFPDVLNVVAPQLKNLEASVEDYDHSIFQLSTDGLDSLEKVNLSLQKHFNIKERDTPKLLDLFQKLRSAKFLIIDMNIVEVISKCLDQLSLELCPFNNLKCLKIKMEPRGHIPTMLTQVRNYLLQSSSSATFLMDLPQLPQKRSRQQVDNGIRAKKVAKMEEEQQQETLVEGKRVLEVKIKMRAVMEAMQLQLEKMMSQMSNLKMAEWEVQFAAMQEQLSCRYQELKILFLACADARLQDKIEMELGLTNVHISQSDVLDALPSPNVATSSSVVSVGSGSQSNTVVQHS